jgi:hypothetical protein
MLEVASRFLNRNLGTVKYPVRIIGLLEKHCTVIVYLVVCR